MAVIKIPNSRKIVIINVGGNQTAADIVAALKADNFKNVKMIDSPESYPDYYHLAEEKPEYTIFVEESSECRVRLTKVEGLRGDRAGNLVRRDNDESLKAQDYYEHQLRMLKLEPILGGAEEIPFEVVRKMPWFYQDKSPMLYLVLPKVEGVPQAVCEAIKSYFKR